MSQGPARPTGPPGARAGCSPAEKDAQEARDSREKGQVRLGTSGAGRPGRGAAPRAPEAHATRSKTHLPELGTDLVAALATLDVDDLAHVRGGGGRGAGGEVEGINKTRRCAGRRGGRALLRRRAGRGVIALGPHQPEKCAKGRAPLRRRPPLPRHLVDLLGSRCPWASADALGDGAGGVGRRARAGARGSGPTAPCGERLASGRRCVGNAPSGRAKVGGGGQGIDCHGPHAGRAAHPHRRRGRAPADRRPGASGRLPASARPGFLGRRGDTGRGRGAEVGPVSRRFQLLHAPSRGLVPYRTYLRPRRTTPEVALAGRDGTRLQAFTKADELVALLVYLSHDGEDRPLPGAEAERVTLAPGGRLNLSITDARDAARLSATALGRDGRGVRGHPPPLADLGPPRPDLTVAPGTCTRFFRVGERVQGEACASARLWV